MSSPAVDLVVHRQRQRRGLGEHLQLGRGHLDLAGGQVRVLVARRAAGHLAGDLHAELVAQRVRVLLAEHHLDHAGGVAQVDEDDAAVVAPAGHPPGERHRRAGVARAQAAGVMGTDHGLRLLICGPRLLPRILSGRAGRLPGTRRAGPPRRGERAGAGRVPAVYRGRVRAVPSWAVVTAAAAPASAGGGLDGGGRPGSRAATTRCGTRSASWRGRGRHRPWLMAVGLVAARLLLLRTAAGLHAAGLPSRFLLALGGVATIALIAFPRPQVGGSPPHGWWPPWRCSPWRSGRPGRRCGCPRGRAAWPPRRPAAAVGFRPAGGAGRDGAAAGPVRLVRCAR